MNELVKEKSSEENLNSKKFRLVVKSAEEAVRVIRDKLGEDAKVLSVRQLGGEGLKRFISSPKLEVIAEVPSPEAIALSQEENSGSGEGIDALNANTQVDTKPPIPEPIQKPSILDETKQENPNSQPNNVLLLSRSGFDPFLLKEIQSWDIWKELKDKPFADVLKEITIGLSDRFRSTDNNQATPKVALIGSPGVGKTTTLCKFLAHEVFMNKSLPSVLKVENGMPNPDDALRIFCEVIGVTLFRQADSLPEANEKTPLYLDFPGLSVNDSKEWAEAGQVLDSLNVETRVLVINGAYEREIILKEIRMARYLGATHLAITHFDEISNSTKLWPLVLGENLSPLCICNGQNVTGDFSTNVLNQMIARTFPEELYSRGFNSYRHAIS